MSKSPVLALILALALLLPVLPVHAQPMGKYRYYVDVKGPGNYELAVDIVNHGFPSNGTLNPLSVEVIAPDGSPLPISTSFEKETVIKWELEHKNAASFIVNDELCFFATGPDPSIKVMVDRSALDDAMGFAFSAKGRFRVALRDASLMRVVSETEVSSDGYTDVFLGYSRSLLERDRPYAFFILPGPELACMSDLKLVSGNLLIRWRADSPGEYVITLDKPPANSKRIEITSAKRVEPKRVEAFVVVPSFPSNLSGVVDLSVEVSGNLSPVTRVQARLDYEGQYNWTDDKGVLIDFKPSGGSWRAKWDTLTTWDGRHVMVIRAYDSNGGYAEFRKLIWVENIRNGTRLFPDRNAFSFIVLGDNRPSGGAKQPEVYRQLLEYIIEENADFYANVGDIVYSGELREYEDFVRITSAIRMPLFIAEGNHENQIGKIAQRNFMSFFGKLFYSFDYGNSHFVFLNANVPGFRYSMSDEQIEWFAKDLDATEAEHVFIFIHQPIYPYAHGIEDKSVLERLRAVLRLHKDKIDAIFQGHEHMYYSGENESIKTFILGGGGAELDNQYPKEYLFFHYMVVRVNGGDVSYQLVKPPVLEVNDLPDVVDTPSLEVRGRAQPFALVKVNGQEVRPSNIGTFSSTISLTPGENDVIVEALYNSTRLERRFKVTYLPHAQILLPDELEGNTGVSIRVTCRGGPATGLLVFNGTVYELENGETRLKVPDIGEEIQVKVAAYAEGCFPSETYTSVRPKPPFILIGGVVALAILIAAILLYRRRFSARR
ncbi:MAG: metallophosphoesterase [Candidatus Korarchaeota archaeon]|nr:metallophosphoesterase [Candidatus Korarchaeota archaeon]